MQDLITLVCLFHDADRARSAAADLHAAGVPDRSVSLIGSDGSGLDALEKSDLASLGMPDRDYDHLKEGVRDGGIVLAVASAAEDAGRIESIFQKHSAEKIDETERVERNAAAPASLADVPAEGAIPIVEESLAVGKRTVDKGGVRLYRRVVEIPVETAVDLREEHVSVDRIAVDRPVAEGDLAFQPRTIELTETAEEAVVVKDARVVEEIVVSKLAAERLETITDTVRRTEVDIEELPAEGGRPAISGGRPGSR